MACITCNSFNGNVCTLHEATFTNKDGSPNDPSNLEKINRDFLKLIEKRLKLKPKDPKTFSCSDFKELT